MDYQTDIDIVLPWVDPNDPIWQEAKRKYSGQVKEEDDDREIRYRDWDNLQYVFRSIEKYAPWVRKIHFVTFGHLPKWMNVNAPKLHIVRHEEYIPAKYLPVFSSHVIELNMHRIEDLSEKFIYFNDDIFLINKTTPEDFFVDDLPCDVNIPNLIVPNLTNFSPIVFNTVGYINKHFNKKALLKKEPGKFFNIKYGAIGLGRTFFFLPWGTHTGFYNHHLAVSYLKSTLQDVWSTEPEIMEKTCEHRFRDNADVNQYIFRFWQLASGRFHPNTLHGKYFKVSTNNKKIIRYLDNNRHRMICINDDEFDGNFDDIKNQINSALAIKYPEKSSFEI